MTDAQSASASAPADAGGVTDEQLWDEMRDDDAGQPDGDGPRDEDRRDDSDDRDDDGERASEHSREHDDEHDDDASNREQSPSEGQDDDDDPIWADATPEQREAIRKLRHDLKSQQGRVRALARARSSAAQRPSIDKEAIERRRADLARVQEEYGDVVGPIAETLSDLETRMEHYAQAEEAEQRAILDAENEALLTQHPDFYDTLRQHADTFQQWVDDQPRAIREAVQANSQGIVDADAAASVFQAFKSALRGAQQPPAQNQDRLSERRRRQKAGARSTRSSTPPVSQGVPDDADPEEVWKALAREEARRERGGG